MKKALIITNYFPPHKKGRAEKIATRASLFLKNGWEPIIFIPKSLFCPCLSNYKINKKAEVKAYRAQNSNGTDSASLKSSIPSGIKQYLRILFPFVYFPDGYSRWIIPGVLIGNKIIKKENIDLICSMNNPFSLHLVGYGLKKIRSIPWLAEFRDPWSTNPRIFKNGKSDFLSKFLEKTVVKNCDMLIIHNGLQIDVDYFHKKYPKINYSKIKKLGYLGYLPEYFEKIKPVSFDSFTISYAGSFHEGGEGPENFLRALAGFINNHNLKKGDIRVNFLGTWNKNYSNLVKKIKLEPYIFSYGWIPHSKVISILKGSNVGLFINRGLRGDELNISQKVWDYVGAKIPILALAKQNYKIAELVKNQNIGVFADKDDIKDIENKIAKLYKAYKKGANLFNPSSRFLASVDRKKVTEDLCSYMNQLIKKAKHEN